MSQKVIIFGTDDFAEVADVYLAKDSPYEVVAFTADDAMMTTREFRGRSVIPFEELQNTHPPDACEMFVAVGYSRVNKARTEVYARCKDAGYRLISYVNSKAIHWGEVEWGDNCFIFEANVIQPFVRIGNNVIIWSGNHIGHHTKIGSHCFIASHAVISGRVTIGDYCFLGVNATIRDGVSIAPHCVIGAGVPIMRDTKAHQVYVPQKAVLHPISSDQLKGI